jgi:hypothetical protein
VNLGQRQNSFRCSRHIAVQKSSGPCENSAGQDSRIAGAILDSGMAHISGFERDQLLLLPEAVDDYVGSDNPVRFIDAFVDGCVSAPKRDPSPEAEQCIEFRNEFGPEAGSRSAPIGTPSAIAFSMLHQRIRSDSRGGPNLVPEHRFGKPRVTPSGTWYNLTHKADLEPDLKLVDRPRWS